MSKQDGVAMTLDELRAALCKGEFSSLHISWNDDNGSNYTTVREAISRSPDVYAVEDFVGGEAGMQACIAANSIWSAQWYPDTPVGFCVLHAPTFEALREALERQAAAPPSPGGE